MQLQAAVLCDAASVRDGLLFALGAGISRFFVEEYPSQLELWLAVIVELERAELGIDHQLGAELFSAKGKRPIARLEGKFQSTAPVLKSTQGLHHTFPFVLRLQPKIDRKGDYRVELRVGSDLRRTLRIWVGPRRESVI